MAEGDRLVEQFDRELEELVTRYHAVGLDPTLALSRLSWQLVDVALGCSCDRATFFATLQVTWDAVVRDWERRKRAGGVLMPQSRTRGQG